MDGEFTLIFTVPKNLFIPKSSCEVECSNAYNRKVLSLETEKQIDEIWGGRLRENSTLFDGTKFRLGAVEVGADGRVLFKLGYSRYKDFLGTNWSPEVELLRTEGLRLHGDSQAFLADCFGVNCMLKSSDNSFVFIRRSQSVAEAQGMVDTPGGHPEPGNIDKQLTENHACGSLYNKCVLDEIFDAILAEIVEEINIPRGQLEDALLIGMIRNIACGERPLAVFYVSCKLFKADIMRYYKAGTQDGADESVGIVFLTKEHILSLTAQSPDWPTVAPCAKGAITLYQKTYLANQQ